MLLSTAYNELMHHRPKNSYRLLDGKIFIDSGWIALAIFQSLNRQNFGVVRFYDGKLKGEAAHVCTAFTYMKKTITCFR